MIVLMNSNYFYLLLVFISICFSQFEELCAYDSGVEVEVEENEGYSYAHYIDDDLSASQDPSFGHLTGDVQNWAAIIQNYILQLANDDINRQLTQELFDLANYTVEAKSGEQVVKDVKVTLSKYFALKQASAYVIENYFYYLA